MNIPKTNGMNIRKTRGMNISKTYGMNLPKTNGMNIKKNTKGMDIQTSNGMGIGKKGDYSQFDEYKRIREYLATKPVSHTPRKKTAKAETEVTRQDPEIVAKKSPEEKLFSSSLHSIRRSYRKFRIVETNIT